MFVSIDSLFVAKLLGNIGTLGQIFEGVGLDKKWLLTSKEEPIPFEKVHLIPPSF